MLHDLCPSLSQQSTEHPRVDVRLSFTLALAQAGSATMAITDSHRRIHCHSPTSLRHPAASNKTDTRHQSPTGIKVRPGTAIACPRMPQLPKLFMNFSILSWPATVSSETTVDLSATSITSTALLVTPHPPSPKHFHIKWC